MTNNTISIQDRTKQFAVRVIYAYTQINDKCHFSSASAVLSKQFLRSGTSIGANCAEAKSAQSNKDFISKYEIALKEAQETIDCMSIRRCEATSERVYAFTGSK